MLGKAFRPLTIAAKHRMVRDERYKLVYAPTRAGVRWLLYDTLEDPGEERDVAAGRPEVLARLQRELRAWMLRDPETSERGDYLVPRDAGEPATAGVDVGVVRLEDGAPPPAQAAP